MFRYVVLTGPRHLLPNRPRGFDPEESVELEIGGLVVRIFITGGGRMEGGFFRGVVGEGSFFVGESITPEDSLFPERAAASHVGRLPDLLHNLDGFYGGVLVGEGLAYFTDHVGAIPVYISHGPITVISNTFSEMRGYQAHIVAKPSTVTALDGTSTVYWRPPTLDLGEKPAELLWKTLVNNVVRYAPRRSAIFFSGGLDSTLLARACNEAGLSPILLCVGVEGARDRLRSRRAAELLGLELVEVELSAGDIEAQLHSIIDHIPSKTAMDASIALAFHTLSLKASEMGLNVAVAGQGADELYGGYHKYIQILRTQGYDGLKRKLEADVAALHEVGLPRDVAATREGGAYLLLPYLSRDMLSLGLSIPARLKIAYVDGMFVRKHILREVARYIGLSEIADLEKKALQYGTGLEKLARRVLRGSSINPDYVG